jgi:ATP-dependent protease ClpP protease subunit
MNVVEPKLFQGAYAIEEMRPHKQDARSASFKRWNTGLDSLLDRSSLEPKIEIHKGYRIASIKLRGEVGGGAGFESNHFRSALQQVGRYDMLYAVLDSSGGSVFDAWVIYDYLKSGPASRYPSLVHITGQCSGIAILVALGFQQILMRPYAYMRFERIKLTNADAGRRASRLMANLIARHARCDRDKVFNWTQNNYVFTAKQCLRHHVCHAIV